MVADESIREGVAVIDFFLSKYRYWILRIEAVCGDQKAVGSERS
jgi:hypothetical protein